ncbi:RAB7A-interacting MON1-CCZ1 complex subunit 1 isoform X3 [Elephas maximus indicus]|uniref:RAB7A-interacting MON1-CCZ1 complex subunit 1 isoform X3 n=1 Tax=Elephas maximus indicus TaxID=99487 RepID=UPI002115DFE9|nr:RAB7A-interacting MON1-CCZ1 complex subunit 1 isoform X3 [Elephas maximus indicus]
MAAADSTVVKRVEELGDLAQAHIQQLSEAAGEDDHFLIRASAALEKLKILCGEDKECSDPSNLLELYTQHCSLLGDELLECLSWRRGALLYMYCHSLTKRREWLSRKSSLLKKYLVDGINYLIQMLNYRCPVELNEGVSFQDLETAKLLSEGIFSDIHLLAMMYSGEMCYWGLKHCASRQSGSHDVDSDAAGASCTSHKEPLDFREVGEKILKKYVSVCEGPLREQEWNTTNAKQILNFFQHCHK